MWETVFHNTPPPPHRDLHGPPNTGSPISQSDIVRFGPTSGRPHAISSALGQEPPEPLARTSRLSSQLGRGKPDNFPAKPNLFSRAQSRGLVTCCKSKELEINKEETKREFRGNSNDIHFMLIRPIYRLIVIRPKAFT